MSWSLSPSHILTLKPTSEPDENFMHFLVEKLFSYNTASLDIINIDTSAS